MRILVAEDSQVSRRMLEQQLTKMGHDVVIVENGSDAWEVLQRPDSPEIALLDWMMPGMEGPEVCQRVRELHAEAYKYLVLVTMKERTEEIAEGLAAGADDFITKPFEPMELRARLEVGERVIRYAERLRRANADLARLATTDELTRVYNRGAILDRLDQEFNRNMRLQAPISLLMLDIDHFKECNDRHGHAAGDAALRMTADAIQSACRIYDLVGRYGGDEFLIGLPGADEAASAIVAERIRSKLGAISAGGERFNVTVSIGSATWRHDSPHSAQSTIRAADAALYSAKDQGRDRVVVATPAEYERARNAPTAEV